QATKLWYHRQKLWIPSTLWYHFLFQIHISTQHTSITEEMSRINQDYYLEGINIKDKLKVLHERCLHCHHRIKMIRRPLFSNWHASKPNQIIHIDYLKIYTGYLLVLCDDFSRKVELVFSATASADTTVDAIL